MNKKICRLYIFDLIRAIAVLLVLFGHCFLHALNIDLRIHGIGVGMFFFISGYLISLTLERNNSISFIRQRFFRLVPVLIFVILTFSIIKFIIKKSSFNAIFINLTQGIFFIGDFFENYGIAGIDTWTLNTEVRFYLIIWLVYYFFKQNFTKNMHKFIISIYCTFFVIFFPIFFYAPKSSTFQDATFNTHCVVYLFFGVFYFLYDNKKISIKELILYFIINYLTILILKLFIYKNISYNIDLYMIGMIISLCFVLSAKYFQPNKVISYIAKISYSIYIIHHPFVFHFGFFGIIMTFVISHFTYKYIEMPFIQYGKNRHIVFKNI